MENAIKKKLFQKQIIEDHRYQEIYGTFEKLFRCQGFYSKDVFDSRVWFLGRDPVFQSLIDKKNKTPQKPNTMCKILSELNENDELSDLRVLTKNFIYKVCEVLIEHANIIDRSEGNIKLYNANQKISFINENLKILSDRIGKVVNPNYVSHLNIKIMKMEKFPIGEYEHLMKVNEVALNDKEGRSSSNSSNFAINQRTYKLPETVKVISDNKELEVNLKDFTFKTIDFQIFENKMSEDLFKIYSNSGTTLRNLQLMCIRKNKNRIYESKILNMLDLALMYIDEINDITKNNFVVQLNLKLTDDFTNLENPPSIFLEMSIQWDDLTRSGLLKRVLEIFNGLLATKISAVNEIDEILEYFPSISESTKAFVLKKDEKRESCCTGCNIY